MTFKFSQRSRDRMTGVDQRLIDIFDEAISISPIDFGIPADGGVRTAERQKELFKKGLSKLDGVTSRSNHQDGKALDFFAVVLGVASWDRVHLSMIAAVIMSVAARRGVKVRWGGDFGSHDHKGWDAPHIELAE